MKKGKNPTVAQKVWIQSKGLNPKEWLVVKWNSIEVVLLHRSGGYTKSFTAEGEE